MFKKLWTAIQNLCDAILSTASNDPEQFCEKPISPRDLSEIKRIAQNPKHWPQEAYERLLVDIDNPESFVEAKLNLELAS